MHLGLSCPADESFFLSLWNALFSSGNTQCIENYLHCVSTAAPFGEGMVRGCWNVLLCDMGTGYMGVFSFWEFWSFTFMNMYCSVIIYASIIFFSLCWMIHSFLKVPRAGAGRTHGWIKDLLSLDSCSCLKELAVPDLIFWIKSVWPRRRQGWVWSRAWSPHPCPRVRAAGVWLLMESLLSTSISKPDPSGGHVIHASFGFG